MPHLPSWCYYPVEHFTTFTLYALLLIPFNHNLTLIASSLENTNIIFLTPGINNFCDGLSFFFVSPVHLFQLKWKLNGTEYDNPNHVCSTWLIWVPLNTQKHFLYLNLFSHKSLGISANVDCIFIFAKRYIYMHIYERKSGIKGEKDRNLSTMFPLSL